MRHQSRAVRRPEIQRSSSWWPVVVSTVLTLTLLGLSYWLKVRCFGPTFDANGSTAGEIFLRGSRNLCYTDIQTLWGARGLYEHIFPYLHGGLGTDGSIPPGFMEYPVLAGVAIYFLALPAATDLGFFNLSAAVLSVTAVATSILLARFTGWRALWFAMAPALVLYAFLNWDLLVVLATVGALVCVWLASRGSQGWLVPGAALLAIGGALKFYPLMFALPIVLWLGFSGLPSARAARDRWRLAALFAFLTLAVFAVINLPFVILDFQGWFAAYKFQWTRPIDFTTNSIWFWGFGKLDPDDVAKQNALATASTVSTVWRSMRGGVYPWLQVCAGELCVYLLLNKVHSPQYMLWLLPFFVLLRIPWTLIIAYFIADAATGLGAMLMFSQRLNPATSPATQLLLAGVWGRAGLLVLLVPIFVASKPAWASSVRRKLMQEA
ncbi:MAG: hypothetical protein HIU81_07795 [Acidobacteria bacterium]|nr:hypothetical protein [Acidobacteriota bacterium]